ncbi:hypothetical protein [Geomonas sp.]|uniref:hypothetical protein n=1 Tax=Geomonas sp. TaxID=2651584 RepID=UPI002B49594B|nr:hypothetical protein [Geomonas sp.]HJV33842.1 hypothetical protein [Geomonas sp.]
MKGMKKTQTTPPRKMMDEHSAKPPVAVNKHDMMMRREPNHNVHIITPHGNIQSGRKGRTG